MRIHVHNGVINEIPVDYTDVAVFNAIDGFYVRFKKKKRKIIIATLNRVLHLSEKKLYESLINQYKAVLKSLQKDEIIYSIIYGKGVRRTIHDAPNKPIMCFFDMTIGNKHLSLKDFESVCIERNYPMLSVLYDGPYIDKYKGNYLVRSVPEVETKIYTNLCKRLFWYDM